MKRLMHIFLSIVVFFNFPVVGMREPSSGWSFAQPKNVILLKTFLKENDIASIETYINNFASHSRDEQLYFIQYAIELSNMAAITLLIGNGSINQARLMNKGRMGASAIHHAAWNNNLDLIKYLIDSQEIPSNAATTAGVTPLYICATGNHLAAIEFLLAQQQTDVNFHTKLDKYTALHIAIDNNNVKVVEKLIIDKRTNKNALTKNDETPFSLAAERGHLDIVKLLSN